MSVVVSRLEVRSDGRVVRERLALHLALAAAMASYLSRFLGRSSYSREVARTAVVSAALHDLGKAHPLYQREARRVEAERRYGSHAPFTARVGPATMFHEGVSAALVASLSTLTSCPQLLREVALACLRHHRALREGVSPRQVLESSLEGLRRTLHDHATARELLSYASSELSAALKALESASAAPPEALEVLKEFSSLLREAASYLDDFVMEILRISYEKLRGDLERVRVAAGILMLSDVAAVKVFLRSVGAEDSYSSIYSEDIDKLLRDARRELGEAIPRIVSLLG